MPFPSRPRVTPSRKVTSTEQFAPPTGFTKLPSLNLNDRTGLLNLEAIGKLSNLPMLYLCRCTEITDLKPP